MPSRFYPAPPAIPQSPAHTPSLHPRTLRPDAVSVKSGQSNEIIGQTHVYRGQASGDGALRKWQKRLDNKLEPRKGASKEAVVIGGTMPVSVAAPGRIHAWHKQSTKGREMKKKKQQDRTGQPTQTRNLDFPFLASGSNNHPSR